MGYDFDTFIKGFSSDEELRDYVFSSPRIHRDFLTADSENTKHRKRDRLIVCQKNVIGYNFCHYFS